MSKVNLAITVDSYVANWLNEQDEKRSTLINHILKNHIIKKKESKRANGGKRREFHQLSPTEKKNVVNNSLRKIFPDWDEW